MACAHKSGRLVAVGVVAGLVLCAGAAFGQDDVQPRMDGHRVLRLWPQTGVRSVRDLNLAAQLSSDMWTHSPRVGKPLEVRVSVPEMAQVVAAGVPFEVVVDDVQRAVDREREVNALAQQQYLMADGVSWYTAYWPYADVRTYVNGLAAAYPNLASVVVLGTSQEGREIFALRITGPTTGAGVLPLSRRPAVVYNGCQHAREWVTVPANVYIGEQLLEKYATDSSIRSLVDGMEFVIVPIVNPDGYVHTWASTNNRLWRKTRNTNAGSTCRGTDPNRNWDAAWGTILSAQAGSTNPCSDVFVGQSAFSAKETQVLRDYFLSNPRVRGHIDIHSFSQLSLWPYGFTATPSPDQATFDAVGTQMQTAIAGVAGAVWQRGPVYSAIYPVSGGSIDWTYGARGVRGFSFELRDTGTFGFQLPADQILPSAEEAWRGALVLAQSVSAPLPGCAADCDASGALSPADFTCFLAKYRAGGLGADCDASGALSPADFTCYLGKYRAGCP